MLRSEKSAAKKIIIFDKFSLFSGLKINNAKSETIGIYVKKGVKITLYEMKCINLTDYVVKILGIYFSDNKKIEQEKKFIE